MKKKLKMLLSKLRESKFFKIFFSTFLIFGVLLSCVVVPSSAAEPRATYFIPKGVYQFKIKSSDLQPYENVSYYGEFNFKSNNQNFNFMRYVVDQYGFAQLFYGVLGSDSYEILVWDSENYFNLGDYVGYDGPPPSSAYCYIDVRTNQYATVYGGFNSPFFPEFFAPITTNDLYYFGYWGAWYTGFDVGYDQGLDQGYDQGFEFGSNSNASASLGNNLIGDTLSAPMTALNNFVLYTSPSGVQISLGLVLGSVIALTFFIAFLKLFAGG